MKRIPVVAQTKPLIKGVPPIVPERYESFTGNIVIPKFLRSQQIFFSIEVLPSKLIDAEENWVLAGHNDVVMAILMSSLFPIWVRGVAGKDQTTVNFKSSYNTFPFPEFSKKQENILIERVSAVLKARGTSSGRMLSDLYCSGNIPEHLEMAHEDLDEEVLALFGLPAEATNEEILEKLFSEYMRLINN